MTKLLVSDYDLTLYINDFIMQHNIKKIIQLRKEGHKFAIATARSHQWIMKKIKYYQIPYDYLSCFNGGVLFDNQNNVLFSSNISDHNKNLIENITNDFKMVKNIEPLIINDQNKNITIEYILNFYLTKLNDREQLQDLKNYLKSISSINHSGRLIKYIYNEGNDKANTVSMMKQDCQACEVYTIGDYLNDQRMIGEYNGYSMPWSHPKIKKLSVGSCLSVGSLANQIINGKANIR